MVQEAARTKVEYFSPRSARAVSQSSTHRLSVDRQKTPRPGEISFTALSQPRKRNVVAWQRTRLLRRGGKCGRERLRAPYPLLP